MPKVNEMYPSKYLKAADCEDGDLVLTIDTVRQEKIGQGDDADMKWVVFFVETEKKLVLNKTNTTTIAKLYGNDTDDWVGKQITLFATEVQFGTDMVEAVRVRSKPPKTKAAPAPAKPKTAPMTQAEADEDIPF